MFDEPFAQGNSYIHSIDPRIRICAAGFSVICLAFTHTLIGACTGCLLGIFLLLCSRPPIKHLLKKILIVNFFTCFLWLTVPWDAQGEIYSTFGWLPLSYKGLMLCLLITIKTSGILFLFLALMATINTPTVGYALEQLGFSSKLVFLFLFTYRYIHVIADEWQRMHIAARLRGFIPHTNLHTYRTIGYILGMVLVRSHERAHRVYEAMLLRGFHGHFFSVINFRTRLRDGIFALFIISALIAITLLDRWEMLNA